MTTVDIISRLEEALGRRRAENTLRTLSPVAGRDFCSNDYLGFSRSEAILQTARQLSETHNLLFHGSTGSRLISGNHEFFNVLENKIAAFHKGEAALIFNSGFAANTGLFSCIAKKGDTILYDELVHASIRDGIRLSPATSWSFKHNDLEDLRRKAQKASGEIFIATESVFSMDGDYCPLEEIVQLSDEFGASIILDEAHSTGVTGECGEGLAVYKGVQNKIFARIHTFGKALGAHGAAVIGGNTLINYLVNFSRPFIYTTAPPPATLAAIYAAYLMLENSPSELRALQDGIKYFNNISSRHIGLTFSDTPIKSVIAGDTSKCKSISRKLSESNFAVKPIYAPTVAKGSERLRVTIHAFNSEDDISELVSVISKNLF